MWVTHVSPRTFPGPSPCQVQRNLLSPKFWHLKPAFLSTLESQFLSTKGDIFPRLPVVSSSKSKHMLAPRLPQYPKHLIHTSESMLAAWLLSALLTPDPAPQTSPALDRPSSATHSPYNPVFSAYPFSFAPLSFSSLCLLLLLHPPWSSPACWPCLVHYFLSLLLTLRDVLSLISTAKTFGSYLRALFSCWAIITP